MSETPRGWTLKTWLLGSFFSIIALIALLILLISVTIIRREFIDRAQTQVVNDLKVARMLYQEELEIMQSAFSLLDDPGQAERIRERLKLDYVRVARPGETPAGEIAARALASGEAVRGSRLIETAELLSWDTAMLVRIEIPIAETPKSRPRTREVVDRALAIECAQPLRDDRGRVTAVVYGGRILNRNNALVDRIRDFVFDDRVVKGRPFGTVTIFKDEVRIATNVLDQNGERAIGTMVSAEVYDRVIGEGRTWIDRAFVVTDWYLSAYEPIRDIEGRVIGILYVGILEKPFIEMAHRILLLFAAVILAASALASVQAVFLASAISRPLTKLLSATGSLAVGDLDYRANIRTPIREINAMAHSFDQMAAVLSERESSLATANENLSTLNKRYLDLIGFVAHELKGILSSTILNTYSLRDGFLGMINFKQRKALDSIARNLDYLAATVKNFLNLSRIEKGEMQLNRSRIRLKADIVDVAIEAFAKQAFDRGLSIENRIDPELTLEADADMLLIVVNNLVSNAIKYGTSGGRVVVSAEKREKTIEVTVYNDGRPIATEDVAKLFKRFSRLPRTHEDRKNKGTGLGLFITREIVVAHGGEIRVEPREGGNAFVFTIATGGAS
jgi:signal transduction histidine kinase